MVVRRPISDNVTISPWYSWHVVFWQADVEEAKIKQFQKLKELPPMQLRQVSSIVTKTMTLAENKSI